GVGTLASFAALGGANAEHVPVILVGGGPGLGERDGRHVHHMPTDDIETPRRMAAEIVERAVLLDDPATAYETIEETLDVCRGNLRPVFMEVPRDLFDARPEQVWRHAPKARQSRERIDLELAAIDDLAGAVDAAQRPVIWSGVGVLRRRVGERVVTL